ncbi:MAG: HDOD domain-containing protein [bacterium]|jgi:HD-like signal output (HDOD) protein|nr:HDOD domain-containing protein [bacterium]
MTVTANIGRIRRIAQGIHDLPTLPTVVAKIIQLVDNPRTNAATLARLIAGDPALTARMLKMANSAYYGFPRRIGTINLAIVVLGFNTVRDLAVSASLVERINLSHEGDGGMGDFWEHSVSTAVASRMLQRTAHNRTVGEAFVAGLLHDIGRLVVARYLPEEFQRIQEALAGSDQPLWTIEHELLGMSHAEIGGTLCRHWNLPEAICDAIHWHHMPMRQEERSPLTCILHVAEYMAHRSSRNPHQEGRLGGVEEGAADVLGLRRNSRGETDLVWYLEQFQAELQRAETFRGLVLGRPLPDSEVGHDV